MRLSDVVSYIDLSIYPEIGLGIFFVVFVAVCTRAIRTDRAEHARHASIPFDTDPRGTEDRS